MALNLLKKFVNWDTYSVNIHNMDKPKKYSAQPDDRFKATEANGPKTKILQTICAILCLMLNYTVMGEILPKPLFSTY